MDDEDFIASVLYFQQDKGDPTRSATWDEERCRRLMPAFYKAWQDLKLAEDVLDRMIRTY